MFLAVVLATFLGISGVEPLQASEGEEQVAFARCWDFKVLPNLSNSPAADRSNAYFVDTANNLTALDLKTGVKVWSTEIGGEAVSDLLVTEAAVFVVTAVQDQVGTRRTTLRSISRHTGIGNWQLDIQGGSRGELAIGSIGGLIVGVSAEGEIAAIDHARGLLVWGANLGSRITALPHFAENRVTVATQKGEIVGLNVVDGAVVVSLKADGVNSLIYELPNRFLFGDDRGNLVLRAGDDTHWRFKNGARIAYILPFDSEYIASSNDNFVYKFSRSGNVEWKRRLSGRIGAPPLIIASTGIFATVGDGNVYIVNLRNGKILNRIETGDENQAGVAVSVDPNQGFVVAGANSVSFYSAKCPAK